MRRRTDHPAARRFDELGRIALKRMAERIVGSDEIPGVTAGLGNRLGSQL